MPVMNTPDHITELQSDEIFVFGSNMLGKHIGGAARQAHENFGAIWGKPEGIQGESYALPTVSRSMAPYSLAMIRTNISSFLSYARHHPEKTFLLTKIACGIAGHNEEDIAPMFKHAPDNVVRPRGW